MCCFRKSSSKRISDAQYIGVQFTVTANLTGLLAFILGATRTARGPEVAPDATVTLMDVALHELTLICVPFNITALLP